MLKVYKNNDGDMGKVVNEVMLAEDGTRAHPNLIHSDFYHILKYIYILRPFSFFLYAPRRYGPFSCHDRKSN